MPIDLARLLEDRRADKFVLFERHLNSQLLRMLRTSASPWTTCGPKDPICSMRQATATWTC